MGVTDALIRISVGIENATISSPTWSRRWPGSEEYECRSLKRTSASPNIRRTRAFETPSFVVADLQHLPGRFRHSVRFALPQANATRIFQNLGASLDSVPLLFLQGRSQASSSSRSSVTTRIGPGRSSGGAVRTFWRVQRWRQPRSS
jgi:hypothetical protein